MGAQKFTTLFSISLVLAGIVSLIIKGGPLLSIDFMGGTIALMKKSIDVGAWGLFANVIVFAVVSKTGARSSSAER